MSQLFDLLPSSQRAAPLRAAVHALAHTEDMERGAIYTRRAVVDTILDLVGYTSDQALHQRRLLEPSFGVGDFLLPAIHRLLTAYKRQGGTPTQAPTDLAGAIQAVELNRASFEATRAAVQDLLQSQGLCATSADALTEEWLICDDFLLTAIPGAFHTIIGNPPYVRQERIPDALLREYRRRYRTLYDRADLYVPFYERCLDLLAVGGQLGFICANRWLKNRYGGPLRAKIAASFHLTCFINMENTNAFHSEVIAYPAITIIQRPPAGADTSITRVASQPSVDAPSMKRLANAMVNGGPLSDPRIHEIAAVTAGRDPWLLDDPKAITLLRRLERLFPSLEETGCKVGIGVATGADRVFIGRLADQPVEPARKLPLVMAADLDPGRIKWGGMGVINPFETDGSLASFAAFPRFAAYMEQHRAAITRRHVARKNPKHWYRTIDRIYPSLTTTAKLLIPDIKGTATVVYDEGQFYPHHNLYFVVSESWDLRALQAVLRSSVAVMFVSAYCVRMAGGVLRFQAQYLRRIRLPHWERVPSRLRHRLSELGTLRDLTAADEAVAQLYGLSDTEASLVVNLARKAQVQPRRAP